MIEIEAVPTPREFLLGRSGKLRYLCEVGEVADINEAARMRTPTTREKFGVHLRAEREKVGKTMLDVARALGFKSLAHVSDVERGYRRPFNTEQINKVAELLNTDAETLHRLALESRETFTINADLPQPARDFVIGLSRGDHYSDDFWDRVLEMAKKEKERR